MLQNFSIPTLEILCPIFFICKILCLLYHISTSNYYKSTWAYYSRCTFLISPYRKIYQYEYPREICVSWASSQVDLEAKYAVCVSLFVKNALVARTVHCLRVQELKDSTSGTNDVLRHDVFCLYFLREDIFVFLSSLITYASVSSSRGQSYIMLLFTFGQ